MQDNLFSTDDIMKAHAPLADRMRPLNFEEFEGQGHILEKGKVLRKLVEEDNVPSMIFWGPPGSGKTTLATIIANMTDSSFVRLNAIASGVKDIRAVVANAQNLKLRGKKVILFIDEIHRFNKSQQDSLLPYVENGTFTLIGATTENPSFEVNAALLSRCRVFVLEKLDQQHIVNILKYALANDDRGFGSRKLSIDDEVIEYLAYMSDGDARTALNALEMAVMSIGQKESSISKEQIEDALQRTHVLYYYFCLA